MIKSSRSRRTTRSSAIILKARDLPAHRLLVLKRFFQDYKQLEGKQVQVEEIRPAYAALSVIEKSLKRYQTHRPELLKKDGHSRGASD